MAKRLKYKNMDEVVDALNTHLAANLIELAHKPSMRMRLTGVTADSVTATRIPTPGDECVVVGFRKEAAKFGLLAMIKFKDIVALLGRKEIARHFPSLMAQLDKFALAQDFTDFAEMETKVRAAERRGVKRQEEGAVIDKAKVSREERETFLQQNLSYGSW